MYSVGLVDAESGKCKICNVKFAMHNEWVSEGRREFTVLSSLSTREKSKSNFSSKHKFAETNLAKQIGDFFFRKHRLID